MWYWIKRIIEWIKKDPLSKPSPAPSDALPDAIDLTEITWLGVHVGEWKKVYSLKVSLTDSKIIYDQEGTANWPAQLFGSPGLKAIPEVDIPLTSKLSQANPPKGTPLSGNPWVIAKLDGKWTAATHEWMRPGQKEKGKHTVAGDHIKRNEFGSNWKPTVGEQYGFCVSGLCRDARRNRLERTQIVLVRWS